MIQSAVTHERDVVRSSPAADEARSQAQPRGGADAAPRASPNVAPEAPHDVRELRRVVVAFEAAQALRLRVGEQVRAMAEAPRTDGRAAPRAADADALLARIRAGVSTGPVPALGEAYRRHWNDERELLRLVSGQLARHPAWPWLGRVHGVGPALGARLLARLEIERAPTPSSFWAYCGLATVSADVFRCAECGYELSLPAGRPLRAGHRVPATGAVCAGALVPAGEAPRRVAQPRPGKGESAPYDREAKTLCYLIGTSLVQRGGAYKRYYRAQRARLDAEKPDWISRRRHLTALRMTEKLFLAHLWLVWRERLGLPITAPYADARDEAVPAPRPWSMVGA